MAKPRKSWEHPQLSHRLVGGIACGYPQVEDPQGVLREYFRFIDHTVG
jgi:hypothetical protein